MHKILITLFLCFLTLIRTPTAAAEIKADSTTLNSVLNVLKTSAWVDMYERDVFDCSDMALLLDHTLDYFGFDSAIMVGNLWRQDNAAGKLVQTGRHAMLLVTCYDSNETTSYWWVEPTALFMYPCSSALAKYAHWRPDNSLLIVDRIYTTADDACAAEPQEFSWPHDYEQRIADNIK